MPAHHPLSTLANGAVASSDTCHCYSEWHNFPAYLEIKPFEVYFYNNDKHYSMRRLFVFSTRKIAIVYVYTSRFLRPVMQVSYNAVPLWLLLVGVSVRVHWGYKTYSFCDWCYFQSNDKRIWYCIIPCCTYTLQHGWSTMGQSLDMGLGIHNDRPGILLVSSSCTW